jgi:hypothetical protein
MAPRLAGHDLAFRPEDLVVVVVPDDSDDLSRALVAVVDLGQQDPKQAAVRHCCKD